MHHLVSCAFHLCISSFAPAFSCCFCSEGMSSSLRVCLTFDYSVWSCVFNVLDAGKSHSASFIIKVFSLAGDETYQDIFQDFSQMASNDPDKLNRYWANGADFGWYIAPRQPPHNCSLGFFPNRISCRL